MIKTILFTVQLSELFKYKLFLAHSKHILCKGIFESLKMRLTFNGDLVLAGAGVLEQIDLDGDFANAALVWGVCKWKKRVKRARRF
jgi:hypothetical protein